MPRRANPAAASRLPPASSATAAVYQVAGAQAGLPGGAGRAMAVPESLLAPARPRRHLGEAAQHLDPGLADPVVLGDREQGEQFGAGLVEPVVEEREPRRHVVRTVMQPVGRGCGRQRQRPVQ